MAKPSCSGVIGYSDGQWACGECPEPRVVRWNDQSWTRTSRKKCFSLARTRNLFRGTGTDLFQGTEMSVADPDAGLLLIVFCRHRVGHAEATQVEHAQQMARLGGDTIPALVPTSGLRPRFETWIIARTNTCRGCPGTAFGWVQVGVSVPMRITAR